MRSSEHTRQIRNGGACRNTTPPGKVRIRVEACGVCYSDAVTVEGLFPNIAYPRVPGHEVIIKIDALGEGVSGWKIDRRYGGGQMERWFPIQ